MRLHPTSLFSSLLFLTGSSSVAAAVNEPLKVVYSGFGRSGTHSLRAALQRLGYHTCHGEDIGRDILFDVNPELADAFINADFDAIVDETEKLGYNATLDIHGMYWKEIMERRPNAKYIFVIRDWEPWLDSMKTLRWCLLPMIRWPLRLERHVGKLGRFFVSLLAHQGQGTYEEAYEGFIHGYFEKLRDPYERFLRDAQNAIDNRPENALLFDLKKGYPALCKFLNIDDSQCPEEEFPHLSAKGELMMLGYFWRTVEVVIYTFLLVMGIVAWKFSGGQGVCHSTSSKKLA
jgi:Sulfotransferase domain